MYMRKEALEKLKKNDPKKYQELLQKWREYGKRKRLRKNKEKLKRRSKSYYWQVEGYHRYKCHTFRRMAKRIHQRCNKKRITALDLWSIAKKQKLICPLTGEKLTAKNISVDHILPITKGGANNKSNLRLITFEANTAKNSMTDNEFISFCQKIVNHNEIVKPHP